MTVLFANQLSWVHDTLDRLGVIPITEAIATTPVGAVFQRTFRCEACDVTWNGVTTPRCFCCTRQGVPA